MMRSSEKSSCPIQDHKILDCGHCLYKDCFDIRDNTDCPVCLSNCDAFSVISSASDNTSWSCFSNRTSDYFEEQRARKTSEVLQGKYPDAEDKVPEFIREQVRSFSEEKQVITFHEPQTICLVDEQKNINAHMQSEIKKFQDEPLARDPQEWSDVKVRAEQITEFSSTNDVIQEPPTDIAGSAVGECNRVGNDVENLESVYIDMNLPAIRYSQANQQADCAKQYTNTNNRTSLDEIRCLFGDDQNTHSTEEVDMIGSTTRQRYFVSTEEIVLQRPMSSGTTEEVTQEATEIAEKCPEHDLPYTFMCLTCNVWGCQSCPGIAHEENPSGECFILDPVGAVQALNIMYKGKMKKSLTNIRRIRKEVAKEVSGVKVIAGYYEQKAVKLKAILEVVESNLKELNILTNRATSTNADLRTAAKKLNDAFNKTKESDTIEPIKYAMEMFEDCQTMLDRFPVSYKEEALAIPNMQVDYKKDLIGLLATGAPIYGLHERNGGKLWSRVSLTNRQILLHCMRSDIHPNEGVALLTLPFESLRAMVPQESPLLFLDIGWAGERRGRVYVRMLGDTPRSRQALHLCSGEKGPSYRNTIFYQQSQRTFWMSSCVEVILEGGDYENNEGSGGRAIEEDITNGGEYCHPTVDGIMAGRFSHEHWRLSSFVFYLHGNPREYTDTAFGAVTHGLEILRAAAKQDPVSNAYICDCGLVIPF